MKELEDIRLRINDIDKKMAELFSERMEAARQVAEIKKAQGIDIYDKRREEILIEKNRSYINNREIEGYYLDFLRNNIELSKKYQEEVINQ